MHGILLPILSVAVNTELDVIGASHRARQIAEFCGFGAQDQVRIASAISELAKALFSHGWVGKVEFAISDDVVPQALAIEIGGTGLGGPGTPHGDSWPETADMGFLSARRFMDRFDITNDGNATAILLSKSLPDRAPLVTRGTIEAGISGLGHLPSNVALSGATQQNVALTDALESLHAKQLELLAVSARLEETNIQVAKLNEQLSEQAESLIVADRRKDNFLSVLSHELRSPLSAAGMAAQMLERHPNVPEQTIKLSQLMSRQVAHMNRLVEDLMDVSRISRGLVAIAKAPVDMHEVISAAVEQITPAIRRKNHDITVSLPEARYTVTGDRTRLVQVLGNLLGNAVRYTPDGGKITVDMAVSEPSLLISISDNGIGIAPDLMPNLFDLYVQAEQSPDGKNSGLGLGLALVRSLMQAHGGTVVASSDGVDLGSKFELRFALGPAHVEVAPDPVDNSYV